MNDFPGAFDALTLKSKVTLNGASASNFSTDIKLKFDAPVSGCCCIKAYDDILPGTAGWVDPAPPIGFAAFLRTPVHSSCEPYEPLDL